MKPYEQRLHQVDSRRYPWYPPPPPPPSYWGQPYNPQYRPPYRPSYRPPSRPHYRSSNRRYISPSHPSGYGYHPQPYRQAYYNSTTSKSHTYPTGRWTPRLQEEDYNTPRVSRPPTPQAPKPSTRHVQRRSHLHRSIRKVLFTGGQKRKAEEDIAPQSKRRRLEREEQPMEID